MTVNDRQLAALETCEEICERADHMGLGLVKFMVSDVRELTAMVRRGMMVSAQDPKPAALCKREGGCVCGGDLPRVRAGCSNWSGR